MLYQIQQGYVKTETYKGITTIEFFHPQSNSLPAKILNELAKEIHHAGLDDDCKVILLRSGGESTFCAGASFDELSAIKTEDEGLQFFCGFANVINEMRKCPKFIVGRIQGKSVGGGVGLIAACDYAIALEKSEIKLSELAVGIGPFVVGPAIERKIGKSAFSELAIDAASWRSSDWAKRNGLFAEVHATLDGLEESESRLLSFLLNGSVLAMTEVKKMFWKGTEDWDALLHERAAISGKLVLSDFTKKYIEQFKARK